AQQSEAVRRKRRYRACAYPVRLGQGVPPCRLLICSCSLLKKRSRQYPSVHSAQPAPVWAATNSTNPMPQRTIVEVLAGARRTTGTRALNVANAGQTLPQRKSVQPDRYDLGGELDFVTEMIGVIGWAGDQAQK